MKQKINCSVNNYRTIYYKISTMKNFFKVIFSAALLTVFIGFNKAEAQNSGWTSQTVSIRIGEEAVSVPMTLHWVYSEEFGQFTINDALIYPPIYLQAGNSQIPEKGVNKIDVDYAVGPFSGNLTLLVTPNGRFTTKEITYNMVHSQE